MERSNRRLRIGNDDCVPEIDTWLRDNIGYGNWREWIGLTNVPYRSFEFADEQYMLLFILRFGGTVETVVE